MTSPAPVFQSLGRSRGAGILLHLTSLPSPWGSGDLGPQAESFLDFLQKAGQRYWQFLPLGPTLPVHGHSPYMSPSAFAGNPLLISPEKLYEDGWLQAADLAGHPDFYQYLVNFDEVVAAREKLLRQAFAEFCRGARLKNDFQAFQERSFWLEDYTLFAALSREFAGRSWQQWPADLARREPAALARARAGLQAEIEFQAFTQFLFDRQWRAFKNRAAAAGIQLIGDLPIYVALNSADVWARQECFQLDPATLQPEFVAGVPPDYFSADGQNWGNPLYRWPDRNAAASPVITWWRQRFRRQAELVEIVRIDHFRAFEAYWRIPAAATATAGEWVKGPGADFFHWVADAVGALKIIAEDLGIITPEVETLRDDFGFAGMKVLQFAFDGKPENPYLPWNFTSPNCVVYSGTHDNDTTLGWYLDPEVAAAAKEQARRTIGGDAHAIHQDFIRLAYASTAVLAVIPLQDILGFGSDCRMNCPGSTTRNWAWRCAPRFLTEDIAAWLLRETTFYNRRPPVAADAPTR
ncbi:MAG TPA: 4-alpha-glucanotransferase [Proteobacteria bacterium]|nr:4-alpha-glucanotransferase [Pseudomonadota bacterium]